MSTLDINAIRDYLIKVGCKIEYPILVNAFKQHLYNPDPNVQGKIRTQFKDYVNRLATVSLENNMKFIILRPEFRPDETPTSPKSPQATGVHPQSAPPPLPPSKQYPGNQQVQPHQSQPQVLKSSENRQPQLTPASATQTPAPLTPPFIQAPQDQPPPVPQHKRQLDYQHQYVSSPPRVGTMQAPSHPATRPPPIPNHHQQAVQRRQPQPPPPPQQYQNHHQYQHQSLDPKDHRPLSLQPHQVQQLRQQVAMVSSNNNGPLDVQDGQDSMLMPPPTVTRRSQIMQRTESLNLNSNNEQIPPPRPPPRRRQSNASLFKQPNQPAEKSREAQDIANKSPGRVKEHALKLNSSASTGDLNSLGPIMRSNTMKENRLSRDSTISSLTSVLQRNGSHLTTRPRSSHREDESDSSSLQPIDPLRRKWAIEACCCNYNGLLTLLREDPKLAAYKDIVNGYTALHWAAKFGNLDIIKLMAGTNGVSANIKSSAGYTPLHVAYMFNRMDAAELLIKSYKANPDIRDHSGKRPRQYLHQIQ